MSIFRDPSGKPSMTRTAVFWLLILSTPVVGVTVVYILRPKPDAGVLGAIATVLGAIVGGGVVALSRRTTCDPARHSCDPKP